MHCCMKMVTLPPEKIAHLHVVACSDVSPKALAIAVWAFKQPGIALGFSMALSTIILEKSRS